MILVYDTETLELKVDNEPKFITSSNIDRVNKYITSLAGGNIPMGHEVTVTFKFQELL